VPEETKRSDEEFNFLAIFSIKAMQNVGDDWRRDRWDLQDLDARDLKWV
jgi:hypothetical protein